MRPSNFNLKHLIDNLKGSRDEIDYMANIIYDIEDFDYFEDLSIEELDEIDDCIFRCIQCGVWHEQPCEIVDDEQMCLDCV